MEEHGQLELVPQLGPNIIHCHLSLLTLKQMPQSLSLCDIPAVNR